MREIRFKVKELDCQECAISIKRLLSSIEGVREVSFKYSTQEVVVNVNKNLTKEKIIKFLKRKGYSVVETSENFKEVYNAILFSFVGIIATILLVEILLEKLEVWNFPFKIPSEILIFAVIVGGFNIFKSAFRGLLAKQINADLLMTIATLAALTLKEFVASLLIVFFMNIAHFIEKFTFENSRKAIKELVEQSPKDAIVIRNGKEVEVSIDKIKAGDIILVKPGSRIPVDGKIIFGSSYVNQAPITGEPIPVEKKVGDKVFAGSINQHGILHIKAEKIGEETTLGKIIKLIEEIEVSKAPIQKFADKYSTYYLPAVLLASLATYLITKNPFASIAVLVVACPCAIALATPVAIVAVVGSLARKGIIVKGGLYLEYLAKVDTLVMDKTGTLTYGKPVVTNIVPFNSTELDVLRYAASIERYSEHPIALAILEKAKEKKAQLLKPKSFYYHVGKGISGKVRNSIIAIGNEKLMEYLKVRIPSKISRIKKEFEKMGKTALYVSKDYKIIGVIAISDLIRKEVFSTLKEVEKLGIKRIVLLTGDNEERVKAVANYLHLTEYKANLLPQEKVEYVKKLQSEGRRVLMIGDGVNDAPALMQADVGIAMGSGTDVAIDTSQVILMKDDLSKIPTAIRSARKAFRIIKQNIVFGIIFNISGILLASIGILTPILAAAAQSLPDVVVFLNSSRLLKF